MNSHSLCPSSLFDRRQPDTDGLPDVRGSRVKLARAPEKLPRDRTIPPIRRFRRGELTFSLPGPEVVARTDVPAVIPPRAPYTRVARENQSPLAPGAAPPSLYPGSRPRLTV